MLNIDISDTVAGKQLSEEVSLETTRDMVLDALEERFKIVPSDIFDRVRSIDRRELLRSLHRQAIRSKGMEDFKLILVKGIREK